MSEWKEVSLRKVSYSISYGYTASASNDIIGPKFLRITDITSGRINWEDVPFCSINTKDYEKYKLEVGDIVIARTGATTGYNAQIKQDTDAVFASYLIRFKIDTKVANSFFVGYVLKSKIFLEYVLSIAGGSAQPGANAQQLADFEFLLPSRFEQTAIASILSSLDDKIDLLHRQNKTLEQLAEILFRQWFVEEAEESWEVGKLGDLINVKYGKDHKNLLEGNIPVYGSGGIMRYANKTLYNLESVLIPRKGSLNNIVYIDEPFWTVDTMFFAEMKKPNIAKFVYYFLRRQDLASMNVGSAVPSMTVEIINNMGLNIPPNSVFDKYEMETSTFYKKIKANTNQIRTLTNLRDTLLPKLMSGEVRVSV